LEFAVYTSGPFTRSRVARLTGLPDDVLAHWTKEGLLRPAEFVGGTGRHKEFSGEEVNKAAILAQLRAFNCSIKTLRWFAGLIDRAYELGRIYEDLPHDKFYLASSVAYLYEKLLRGEDVPVWTGSGNQVVRRFAGSLEDIVASEWRELDKAASAELEKLVKDSLNNPFDRLAITARSDLSAETIIDARTRQVWFIWPDGDGWHVYSDSDENFTGISEFPKAGIVLHLSRTLREVWAIPYEKRT
jgi:DNA-binding transcriptional MerR regulator